MLDRIDAIGKAIMDEESKVNLDEVFEFLKAEEERVGEISYQEYLDNETFEGVPPRFATQLRSKASILKAIMGAVKDKISSVDLAQGFLCASQRVKKVSEKAIATQNFSNIDFAEGGEKNYKWLEEQQYENWGRLLIPPGESFLGLEHIDYDELHRKGLYLFTGSDHQTQFSGEVINYRNGPSNLVEIVRDKIMLTLGAGAGADEEAFIKNGARVMTVDGSSFVRYNLQDKFSGNIINNKDDFFNENESGKALYIEEDTTDMFNALDKMIEEGRKVDTVYAHSALHYFDISELKKLLSMIKQVLIPGGHFCFAIKSPGASLDGVGIRVINTTSSVKEIINDELNGKIGEPDIEKVLNRGYLNPDGQIRFFRDSEEIQKIVGSVGFKPRKITSGFVENYEKQGGVQQFDYFIYKNN